MPTIAILLLAAGASSRMAGRDKLMEQVDGEALLSRICRRAAQTGLPCYVTVPSHAHPRVAATGIANVTDGIIEVPDAAEGMAASIRAGVAALPPEIDAVMILPCDMPDLETQDLLHLAAQYHSLDPNSQNGTVVLRATASDGTPGHPVIFPKHCFAALKQIQGDQGARAVLAAHEVQLFALPGQRAVTDLDTPEAWARWRAARNAQN